MGPKLALCLAMCLVLKIPPWEPPWEPRVRHHSGWWELSVSYSRAACCAWNEPDLQRPQSTPNSPVLVLSLLSITTQRIHVLSVSRSAALLRQVMLVTCHLVWGTCSHSGRWALHGLLHIVLLKCSIARHTSVKLEKNPLFYNANDNLITLGSKYITLHASRVHNYKPFPKRVSPHRVGNYWLWAMSEEGRDAHLGSIFELWGLYIHNEHEWAWSIVMCLPHIGKALCWPLQKWYYCCCHTFKKYFNLWTYF